MSTFFRASVILVYFVSEPETMSFYSTENELFSDTVIFFDWDDTLFPTTHFESYGLINSKMQDIDPHSLLVLKRCEKLVRRLILCAKLITKHVYIVTNASAGWVEHTMKQFYPTLCADKIFANIDIISARSQYGHLSEDSPMLWKYFAMCATLLSLSCDTHCDGKTLTYDQFGRSAKPRSVVISIGDSHCECDAIRLVRSEYKNISLKIMKLVTNTCSCDYLCAQLQYVTEWLLRTRTVNHDMTVWIRDREYDYEHAHEQAIVSTSVLTFVSVHIPVVHQELHQAAQKSQALNSNHGIYSPAQSSILASTPLSATSIDGWFHRLFKRDFFAGVLIYCAMLLVLFTNLI